MEFLARERELALLEEEYERENGFVQVCGRRRIGKTRLLREFIQGKPALYYLATKELEGQCIHRFLHALADFTGDESYVTDPDPIDDWESLFEEFSSYWPEQRKIIVIDDLHNLLSVNSAFLKVLESAWSKYLADNNVMLVLCGSYYDYAAPGAAAPGASRMPCLPLATLRIKLHPFHFTELLASFPNLSFSQHIERYIVTGGAPYYFRYFYTDEPLLSTIERHVLDPDGLLFEGSLVILEKEIRDSPYYFSILKVIASDHQKLSGIYGALEQKVNILSPYLSALIDLGLVVKRVPATEPFPEKSRKGHYFLRNNFMTFWYRHVYPHKSDLELGNRERALEGIRKNLTSDLYSWHVSYRICRDIFLNLCARGALDFDPGETGASWTNKKVHLPLVSIEKDSSRVFAALCQYNQSDPVKLHLLTGLKKQCANAHELRGKKLVYGIFSKTGFEDNLVRAAKASNDVILINEAEIVVGQE